MLFNKLKKSGEQHESEQKGKKVKNLLQEDKDKAAVAELFEEQPVGDVKTGFSFRRRKTQKIIKEINSQKVKVLLFYTDVKNILRQLEFGLQPVNNIHLGKNDEYTVWTYLEKKDHLEFELDNSTRHFFWEWIAEQKVDPNQIAIVALDIKKLYEHTKADWEYDEVTRRIKIFENIKPEVISWILVKNPEYVKRIEQYLMSQNNLKIKLFKGEKGNIENLTVKSRKK
ncbi:hypothetical protein [Spiroplasma chrysopicola]|uniref:Acetyltransferase n=1 Tax=Spiroplasma chrysopicola DF-1 TaxID=1276227 RepID=R4U275_9MOLU|nr:hypothetical protein [Spiroplasma chrysopicola]AGM25452.1 hypothetical protein SCHRY_v1c08790 [Spiroplasma chrysopicola DF-1]